MPGYKLLDSGEGEKLEEINGPARLASESVAGGTKIIRKEPRAWWKKTESRSWNLEAGGKQRNDFETVLDLGELGVKCKIKFKPNSKHIGIFPEQFPQWKYIARKIKNYESRIKGKDQEKIKILNLFGYTGIASLVAAKTSARVTHVDASKQSVDWAKENQKLSGLEDAPIRWIVDDVLKFLKREIKRGERYDAIIMDPPSYGKGPKGEVWKMEEELPNFLKTCREILSDQPLFIILNMYSTELSSISVANLLSDTTKDLGGSLTCGELAIPQENSDKLLPMSIFAIWERAPYPHST